MAKQSVALTVQLHDEKLSDGKTVYVAECLELGIASQGDTVEQATQNVKEAVELWLEDASPKELDNYRDFLQRDASTFTTRIEVPYAEIASPVGC